MTHATSGESVPQRMGVGTLRGGDGITPPMCAEGKAQNAGLGHGGDSVMPTGKSHRKS